MGGTMAVPLVAALIGFVGAVLGAIVGGRIASKATLDAIDKQRAILEKSELQRYLTTVVRQIEHLERHAAAVKVAGVDAPGRLPIGFRTAGGIAWTFYHAVAAGDVHLRDRNLGDSVFVFFVSAKKLSAEIADLEARRDASSLASGAAGWGGPITEADAVRERLGHLKRVADEWGIEGAALRGLLESYLGDVTGCAPSTSSARPVQR